MKNTITYHKVFGCPKHGTQNGKIVTLRKEKSSERQPAFQCNSCKRIYREPSNGALGDTNERVGGYSIYNIGALRPVPDHIYVYYSAINPRPCKCKGPTKGISHLLLSCGTSKSVQGIKECVSCGKIFVDEAKKSFSETKTMLNNLGCQLVYVDNHAKSPARSSLKSPAAKTDINNPQPKHLDEDSTHNYLSLASESDDIAAPTELTLTSLHPAKRIASAYYDANIDYNPYQYLPWLKMYSNGIRKLLISDEVGLGKTIEAGILLHEELTENLNSRILVMCPAFLREKWYQELREKFYIDAQIFDGKTAIDPHINVIILPISRIQQFLELGDSYPISMVVVDEIHYFRNSHSARYIQLKKLLDGAKTAKYVFMSATPINNSDADYRSIARLFGSAPEKTNTTKKEAYITLPVRQIKDVYVDLTPEEYAYYGATDDLDPFSGTIYRHIGASCLYSLGRYAFSGAEATSETKEELRTALEILSNGENDASDVAFFCSNMAVISAPKSDTKLDELKRILSSFPNGAKIVIFSHYIETVKYLHSSLSSSYRVGYIYANNISHNIPCRNTSHIFLDAKNWFIENNETTSILICSDSCREGIDLDVANVLINYDLPFNPSILEQRIGRIDRMSQRKDMTIFNFHVNRTYDDRLHFILSTKLRLINYFSNYGIGNPLNVSEEDNDIFSRFLIYFGKTSSNTNNCAYMSNDDFSVLSHLLRSAGISFSIKKGCSAMQLQRQLMGLLTEHKNAVEEWFKKGLIEQMETDYLIEKRKQLELLLNFPPKINHLVQMDDTVRERVAEKANANPRFRIRISSLINGYSEKLNIVEATGLPMHITKDDLNSEYIFGINGTVKSAQKSVVELLRKEGANIYEIK